MRRPARLVSGHLAKNDSPSTADRHVTVEQRRSIPKTSNLNTRIRNPPRNIPRDPTTINPPINVWKKNMHALTS